MQRDELEIYLRILSDIRLYLHIVLFGVLLFLLEIGMIDALINFLGI